MFESTKLQKEAESRSVFSADKGENRSSDQSNLESTAEVHKFPHDDEHRVPTAASLSACIEPSSVKPSATAASGTGNTYAGCAEVDDVREPLIDLFDEGTYVVLIVELPGVELQNVTLELCEDILMLSATTVDCTYQQEILLPASVNLAERVQNLRNGVLEVILPKIT